MDEAPLALGLRAVACNGWRWLPGMALLYGFRFDIGARVLDRVWDEFDGWSPGILGKQGEARGIPDEAIPDLSDPCTVGGLLAIVREAWGDPLACPAGPERHQAMWSVVAAAHGSPFRIIGLGATEAEALVDALESAPAPAAERGAK